MQWKMFNIFILPAKLGCLPSKCFNKTDHWAGPLIFWSLQSTYEMKSWQVCWKFLDNDSESSKHIQTWQLNMLCQTWCTFLCNTANTAQTVDQHCQYCPPTGQYGMWIFSINFNTSVDPHYGNVEMVFATEIELIGNMELLRRTEDWK